MTADGICKNMLITFARHKVLDHMKYTLEQLCGTASNVDCNTTVMLR